MKNFKIILLLTCLLGLSTAALAQGGNGGRNNNGNNGNAFGNQGNGNGNGNNGNGNGNGGSNNNGNNGNGQGGGNNGNGVGNGGSNNGGQGVGGNGGGSSSNSGGASSGGSQAARLSFNNAIEITFYATGSQFGNDVTMSFNNVNDYANGVTSAAQSLRVRSNKDFNVAVKTNATNFSYSGTTSPAPTMPVSGVLGVMITANNTAGNIGSSFSNSSYNTLTNSDQNLISNANRGGNRNFAVKYKTTPGFAYPSGTYTVDVVYTATQN